MNAVDRKQRVGRLPVMLAYPFPGTFDYRVPPDLAPKPGDVVLVPLNGRETVGVVWDDQAGEPAPERKLKPIAAVLDTPPMRPALRRFIDWMAAYTLAPPGEVMAMALRVVTPEIGPTPVGWKPATHLPTPPRSGEGPGDGLAPPSPKLTAARRRVLDALSVSQPQSTADLTRAAAVGMAVLRGMQAAGLLISEPLQSPPPFARPDPDHPGPALSPDQLAPSAALRAASSERFTVTLLDGVTGS
ncbi:MAG: primosomal protein N', partial [Stellaceae bacterium]